MTVNRIKAENKGSEQKSENFDGVQTAAMHSQKLGKKSFEIDKIHESPSCDSRVFKALNLHPAQV